MERRKGTHELGGLNALPPRCARRERLPHTPQARFGSQWTLQIPSIQRPAGQGHLAQPRLLRAPSKPALSTSMAGAGSGSGIAAGIRTSPGRAPPLPGAPPSSAPAPGRARGSRRARGACAGAALLVGLGERGPAAALVRGAAAAGRGRGPGGAGPGTALRPPPRRGRSPAGGGRRGWVDAHPAGPRRRTGNPAGAGERGGRAGAAVGQTAGPCLGSLPCAGRGAEGLRGWVSAERAQVRGWGGCSAGAPLCYESRKRRLWELRL